MSVSEYEQVFLEAQALRYTNARCKLKENGTKCVKV